MAARSGAGTGVVVGLVVFVLSTIFLLVLTIVFYSKASKAQDEKLAAESTLNKYISRTELNTDQFQAIEQNSMGATAMGFLVEQQRDVMGKVLGDPNASSADLAERLGRFSENENATYVDVLQQLTQERNAARSEASGYQQQLAAAQGTLRDRDAALTQLRTSHEEEVQAVKDLINSYGSDVQRYGQDVSKTKGDMLRALQDLENSFDAQVRQMEGTIDNLRTSVAMKDSQLQVYQDVMEDIRVKGQNPALLVDGNILDTPNAEGQVFINRGRVDHVTLGMTFEVYDNESQLTVARDGTFNRGKASIQVIKVGETTSTAKVTRDSHGKPIVRNDVIANAVYDPKKEFLFLVHGKFDLNGDGRPSAAETEQIKHLIRDWGGKIYEGEQMRGDLDFLVLGEQPNQPMSLRSNPSEAEVAIWVEQNQAYQTYNELLRDAMQASIPVLNQNRFLILIGHTNT